MKIFKLVDNIHCVHCGIVDEQIFVKYFSYLPSMYVLTIRSNRLP